MKTRLNQDGLPLRIHDIDHLNFDNIQKCFDWFLNSRVELCSGCEEERCRVQATEIQDPSLIVIDFIKKGKTDQRTINIQETIENSITKNKVKLIATINNPYQGRKLYFCNMGTPVC